MSKLCVSLLRAGAASLLLVGPLLADTGSTQPKTKEKADDRSFIQNVPVDAVEWRASQGGNGHFYKVVAVPDGITWTEANRRAVAAGGHLATITSAEENRFVAKLADASHFWGNPPSWTDSRVGPWLGAKQQPDGKWQWVTEEAFEFTNWHRQEPNTHRYPEETARVLANCLSFYGRRSQSPNGRSSFWSDNPSGQDYIVAFVIEFDEFGPCGESKPSDDQRWEHLVLTQRSMSHLNSELKEAERQGWELVSVIYMRAPWGGPGYTAFVKRPTRRLVDRSNPLSKERQSR